jgi:predicted Zn-dependent protease
MMELKDYFYRLAGDLAGMLRTGEVATCYFRGEWSDFVRFNTGRVRQAGQIRQYELSVDLIEGQRHVTGECNLGADPASDQALLGSLLESLRAQRALIAEDPYLNISTEVRSTEDTDPQSVPDMGTVLQDIGRAAGDLDLVGIYSGGVIFRGFANSYGQRNWHARAGFNFDFSCHAPAHGAERSVKANYSGHLWETEVVERKLVEARRQLEWMRRPAVKLNPGGYRAYLAPAALTEIFNVLSHQAFGLRGQRARQSPLLALAEGFRTLHSAVRVTEHHAGGLAPRFTAEGFLVPPEVPLITAGRFAGALVDARSAAEYGVPVNAGREQPQSLRLAGGNLPVADALAALDTGLYLNNLWYANLSDRNQCRITGMTRHACFWVENGAIRAPIEAMRFDDSVYLLLGERLQDLTREIELIYDTDTYERRSLDSLRLPGALIDGFTLTL